MGRRPGEILDCVHAQEQDAGCGTTEFCRTCGAVQTILAGLQGHTTTAECRILQREGGALDLRVSGSPFAANGQTFCLFAVEDISGEKRRTVLERLFFHDILNLAGVLMGYSELLTEGLGGDGPATEMVQTMHQATIRLIDEIKSQRELVAAESGDLVPKRSLVQSLEFLHNIRGFYQAHEVADGRELRIDPQAEDVRFYCDSVLLERVIGNLAKNALEATRTGEAVSMACRRVGDQVLFTVHNPTVMPREVQLQVFQRSFSTKGQGRGLGTYSVKLFAERYLGGTVTFSSTPSDGTLFKVTLPVSMAD
jgi:signal transduction histidine kinase